MKLTLFIGLIFFGLQESTPYKPKEDFEIRLKYEFRQRLVRDNSNKPVYVNESEGERQKRTSSATLPYLGINLHILKLNSEEIKMRIIDNRTKVVYNKKVKQDETVFVDLGFTDDMKDRVTAHEYTAFFVSAEKKELSRIRITIDEDGTFLVNEEKRGKF